MTRPTGVLKDWSKTRDRPSELLGDIQANMLVEYSKPSPGRMSGVLHPSQMAHGDWCLRASGYELSGVAPTNAREIPGAQLQNIFEFGHDRHAYWQRRVNELGILWGNWRCLSCAFTEDKVTTEPKFCVMCGDELFEYAEVPVDGRDKHGIYGRADGLYLRKDKTFGVLEIKTIGVGTLRMDVPALVDEHTVKTVDGRTVIDTESIWRGLHRPLAPHLRQTNIYARVLREQGFDITAITFIYEYKANQGVKEFTVAPSDRISDTLLDKAGRVVTAVSEGVLLPRPDGYRKDRKPCSDCSWRSGCWGDDPVAAVSEPGADSAPVGAVTDRTPVPPRAVRGRRRGVQ